MIEVRIIPERRSCTGRGAQEPAILLVRDLCRSEQEGINPDAMDRPFAILPLLRAHQKPAFGDLYQLRLDDDSVAGIDLGRSRRHEGYYVIAQD